MDVCRYYGEDRIADRTGLAGEEWQQGTFWYELGEKHVGFNLRNVIMFAGGLFLIYKTVKEIHDKLEGEEAGTSEQ